jgi:hypothetical protein
MQVTLARADVSYQSFFKKPLLDRLAGTPALIQTVYDVLSDNFKISVADILVNQNGGPAENAVTFKLFGAAASIELRSEFWKGTFPRVVSPEDVKLVLRCLGVVSEAIAKASDRLLPSRATVGVAGWYQVSGDFDAPTFFKSLGSNVVELEPSFLDSTTIEYVFHPTVRNGDEGWDATFFVQASVIEGTQLFMNSTSNYVSGGRYSSLVLQAGHAETLTIGMLRKLGFEALPLEVSGG